MASIVFVDFQTTLLDNLGRSSQCCCDGRIANVWQRLESYRLCLQAFGLSSTYRRRILCPATAAYIISKVRNCDSEQFPLVII